MKKNTIFNEALTELSNEMLNSIKGGADTWNDGGITAEDSWETSVMIREGGLTVGAGQVTEIIE